MTLFEGSQMKNSQVPLFFDSNLDTTYGPCSEHAHHHPINVTDKRGVNYFTKISQNKEFVTENLGVIKTTKIFNEFEQKKYCSTLICKTRSHMISQVSYRRYTLRANNKKIDRKWSTKDNRHNFFFCNLTTMLNHQLFTLRDQIINMNNKENGYMTTLFESKYYTASNSWVAVNFE